MSSFSLLVPCTSVLLFVGLTLCFLLSLFLTFVTSRYSVKFLYQYCVNISLHVLLSSLLFALLKKRHYYRYLKHFYHFT